MLTPDQTITHTAGRRRCVASSTPHPAISTAYLLTVFEALALSPFLSLASKRAAFTCPPASRSILQAGVVSSAAVQSPVHGPAPPFFGACGPPAAGLPGHQPARGDAGTAPEKPAGTRAATGPPGVEPLGCNGRKMLYFTTVVVMVVVVVVVCIIRKIAVVRGRCLG